MYSMNENHQSHSRQEMQRDPRKRRDNNSDSGSATGLEYRGEYGRDSSKESRSGSNLYATGDTMHRKSRIDKGYLNRSPRSISRSRSKSPKFKRGRDTVQDPRDPRMEAGSNTRDDWTKTTDAFLKNLGTQSHKSNDQNVYGGRQQASYHMAKTGYVGHGESSHRPYYSDQHMPSAREPTANLPPISAVCDDQMSTHSNTSQNNKMDYSSQDRRRYGGATASPHDVSARNMVSGNSAHRDDRLDSVRMPQKTRSRNCSGDGSSDSGSSMNENNPARVKHNTTGDNRKEHIQGITIEQKEKLISQQKQYVEAKMKLEDQLLKLKEEREDLKERGNRHEDKIMRENAKLQDDEKSHPEQKKQKHVEIKQNCSILQKEVKTRVQYVVEVLSKIEAGLQMPVIRHDKRSATRSPEKEERMVRRLSPGNYERSKKEQERESKKTSGQLGSSVTNAAKESNIETKTIKKKDNTSSEDISDSHQQHPDSRDGRKKSKKKRKKSKKQKLSSSDITDSESGKDGNASNKHGSAPTKSNVIQVDENIFRMMASMNGQRSDGSINSSVNANKNGSSDEMVMGLLSKMSEAYMNSKKENGELVLKIADLESSNEDLEKRLNKQQKKVEKLRRKLQKYKNAGKESDLETSDKDENRSATNNSSNKLTSFDDKNNSSKKSRAPNSNDHIPDILLGDVMKIKRDDTMSPPPGRGSSRTANSAKMDATLRVSQTIDSFKDSKGLSSIPILGAIEEKREVSIRGASPLRNPPERLTRQDADIVRSVRSRMLEKEVEKKKNPSDMQYFDNEYGGGENKKNFQGDKQEKNYDIDDEREKHLPNDGKRSSHDRDVTDRHRRNSPYSEKGSTKEPRGFGVANERIGRDTEGRRVRSKSKETQDRRHDRSRSREWGRGRKRSHSRSRDRSKSKGRRTRSKSRGRSRTPEGRERQRARSRSNSDERYEKWRGGRRGDRGRFGFDNRREERYRDGDRHEKRERETDQDSSRRREDEGKKYINDRERAKLVKEKNDRINIDEWTTKPSDNKDLALLSIKQKLRQKEEDEELDRKRKEHEKEQDEKRQKWSNVSSMEEIKPDPPKFQESIRPQVAIQWGQRDKVTPDPQLAGMQANTFKKSMPIVGKMPWLQRSNKSEERQNVASNHSGLTSNTMDIEPCVGKKSSRFGPPSAVSTTLPPPMVLTSVPPISSNQMSISGLGPVPPPSLSHIQKSTSENFSIETPSQVPITPTFDDDNKNKSASYYREASSMTKTLPSHVDINSMLEAAKQHINRAKETKKETPHETPTEDLVDRDVSEDIEIPLPPLPAAQDKDPNAMLDTRTDRFAKNDSEKSPESEIEKILGKNENVSHNLPPGFNSNKSAVTAQNSSGTTSDGNLQSIQANPAGAHHPYFGPPGTNYYAGHVSGQVAYGGGNAYPTTAQPVYQQTMADTRQKSEEPDASELAMLGIDPSDFAEFGQ